MGKRSKKESSIIFAHPVLKALHDGTGKKCLSEKTLDSLNCLQSGFMAMRMHHLGQIISATGADVDDVIRMVEGMSEDELCSLSDGIREDEYLTFKARLTDLQIMRLLPVFNAVVASEAQTLGSMKALLECRNTKPLKVKNNALCSYMMYMLSSEGYICQNWQYVATKQESFASQNGKWLNEKDYSSSMSKMAKRLKYPVDDSGRYRLNEDIYNIVMGLKG